MMSRVCVSASASELRNATHTDGNCPPAVAFERISSMMFVRQRALVCRACRPASMHLDPWRLQQASHIHEPPEDERGNDADDDQDQRKRSAVCVLAALERAAVRVQRKHCRVIERTTAGDQQDV